MCIYKFVSQRLISWRTRGNYVEYFNVRSRFERDFNENTVIYIFLLFIFFVLFLFFVFISNCHLLHFLLFFVFFCFPPPCRLSRTKVYGQVTPCFIYASQNATIGIHMNLTREKTTKQNRLANFTLNSHVTVDFQGTAMYFFIREQLPWANHSSQIKKEREKMT